MSMNHTLSRPGRTGSARAAGLLERLAMLGLGLVLALLGACGGGAGGSDTTGGAATPPAITVQPADLTVSDGAVAQFSVTASGSEALSYQWSRDGQAINGATQATLSFTAVHASDQGTRYSVQIRNSAGQVTSTAATLTVTPVALQIASAPADITVQAGDTATFRVSVGAGTQPLTYQWLRDGHPISAATAATLTLDAVALSDSGAALSVVVSNAAGSITTPAATLSVSSAATAPAITAQPQSVAVLAGRTASFSVTASGSGSLSYQWYRNGSAVSGATAATHVTPTLAYTDGASYTVIVRNAAGATASSAATLTVNPRVTQVSAGGYQAAARKEDGSVWSWGWSNAVSGDALGAGPVHRPYGTMVRAVRADGTAFADVTALAAGYVSAAAVRADGSVWTWGQNMEGEVGNGTIADVDYPWQVVDSAGTPLSGYTAVSGGYYYTLALKSDGTVWGWGYALQGRLGNNDTGSAVRRYTTPQAVLDNTGAPLSAITQIDAGHDHAVALAASGTVWIWGNGQAGRLGDGLRNSMAYVAQPLKDSAGAVIGGVTQVSAGADHSLLLKSDGSVWGWGVNSYGQLGGGNTTEHDRAYLLTTGTGATFGDVVSVQAGEDFSVLLRSDGTVWTVGRNQWGQLGNGSTVAYATSPVQVLLSDGSPLTGVTQISVHDHTVVVLRGDATVWGWGSTASGELGIAPTNTVQFYAYPQKISVSGD